MQRLQLKEGAPDEPDTGDWNAICATPGPRGLFVALFHTLASGLSGPSADEVSEDETHRVHTFWFGSDASGVKVTEIESPETSAFPMYCTWETFGLPGMKVIWKYALEHAGQLGYAAFRHGKLVCDFDSAADRQRFVEIWQRQIGKTPVFEPVEKDDE
jgi:hypothetical protein